MATVAAVLIVLAVLGALASWVERSLNYNVFSVWRAGNRGWAAAFVIVAVVIFVFIEAQGR